MGLASKFLVSNKFLNLHMFIYDFHFISGEFEVELLKNSQHLLPYRSIASLLQNNAVNLL